MRRKATRFCQIRNKIGFIKKVIDRCPQDLKHTAWEISSIITPSARCLPQYTGYDMHTAVHRQ